MQRIIAASQLLPPRRFLDILNRTDAPQWLRAYLAEVTKLSTKGDMHVVNRPRDARVVKLRELFSVKFDNITKEWIFKVRIVARGDLEVDEEFVYAPVANMPALRLFVVLSLEFGIDFRQLDISSAFLYAGWTMISMWNFLMGILRSKGIPKCGRRVVR